jgi:hypothetical protein
MNSKLITPAPLALALALAARIPGAAQIIQSQTVVTDTNGVLLFPANLWAQNAGGIAAATLTNNLTVSALAGLTNSIATVAASVATRSPQQGLLTPGAGLSVNVGAVNLVDHTGAAVASPPGAVTLAPSTTHAIVLSLGDLAAGVANPYHAFPRALDSGCVLLGTVTTDASKVTAVAQAVPELPPDPFPGLRTAIHFAGAPLSVDVLGTSLSAGSGTGTFWRDELFNPAYAADGLNLPNAAAVTQNVWAVGGTTALYALLPLFNAVISPVTPVAGWPSFAATYGDVMGDTLISQYGSALGNPAGFGRAGQSLWLYEEGVNGGAYDAWAREVALRRLRRAGAPVVVCACPGNAGALGNYELTGEQNHRLAAALGCGFADWWSWIWEANQIQGVNTFADTIHQNQAGWRLVARSVRGALAPFYGPPAASTSAPGRILGGGNASEDARLWDAVEFQNLATDSSQDTLTLSQAAAGAVPAIYGSSNAKLHTIPAGGYITFANEAFTAMSLVVARGAGSTAWTGTVGWTSSGGATTVKSINWSDPSPPNGETPQIVDLLSVSDVLPLLPQVPGAGGLPAPMYNGGMRITIASGTAKILGAVFLTVPKRDLAWHEIGQRGAFVDDTADASYPHLLAGDTDQSELVFNYRGRGLLLALKSTAAGGRIDVWQDGVEIYPQVETYQPAGYGVKNLTVWPDATMAGGALQSGFRDHQCRVRLNGANAAAAAPSPAKHRLNLVYAKIVGPAY